MLKHPTLDLLGQLGFAGMAKAFAEMESNDDAASLSHAEWLALLLDHEATYRNDRRLALRLRHAKLRHRAVPEDVDYRTRRSLDRRLFETLLAGEWISRHENLAIIGPTGIGKSGLACAIGHKACRDNRSVLYTRLLRLIDELTLAKGDGRIAARMKSLTKVELLILDDWGLQPLDGNARPHLLQILEDRYGQRLTLVTSQLPVARWHQTINDPTYANAILDRLVHYAHRLELEGESMRRPATAAA
ncbi:IS21-like element helper ATPase IstB [Novosphingobium colocasiae]|uniref:Insertion sequence ATP-binding protein y4uH n=1 Tax=Novosphingobium colocasiae TaxID=1256513 RepID=A0A918UK56_9SPHN|nr:IS21-like element helper ATPase IstB [Novosphingobium colocasiae]GGZ17526.1 putative insertion sequence ATP-binding protein y4uH [Novosphingobium colocasiae]